MQTSECEIPSVGQVSESVVFTRTQDDAEQTLARQWKMCHNLAY